MNSKQKGKRGELEFAKYCREKGYENVRRSKQYCGEAGDADLVDLPGVFVEVKRVEALNIDKAMAKAVDESCGQTPIVAHRKNHKVWLVTMLADDWFELYGKDQQYKEDSNET